MKGICFIEPMFHKVVKGEKTQTRRIISHLGNKEHYGKLLCHWYLSDAPYLSETGVWKWQLQTDVDDCQTFTINPKYKVGEKVYLKEPYHKDSNDDIHYKFGYPENQKEMDKHNLKWGNKLFMPESAARYFIEITAVRAERLQDVTEEDCIKEGIESFTKDNQLYKFGLDGWDWSKMPRTPREAYAALINNISGKGTWEKNPFVWVYDFKLLK